MRVAIANFSEPVEGAGGDESHWTSYEKPPPPEPRLTLFEQPLRWGFHIHALGVHLLDRGLADEVEYWDFAAERGSGYAPNGVLWLTFLDEDDLFTYLDHVGPPDLFVNHGPQGLPVLERLEGRCFRVHVPALRKDSGMTNRGAECYLVDSPEYLDERSMLYVPVVHTERIRPNGAPQERDFVYLATSRPAKRHDIVVDAVRGTAISGHLHPVEPGSLPDLAGTRITTSGWNERGVVELLTTSRMAVYPGDETSSPAATWECVAAGLPIVVNAEIRGGKHLVVSGATGELARPDEFRDAIEQVLANLDSYRPREYFEEHWDTVETLDGYLDFFERMGFACS
jgi:glycosyltransferase involved in cell wall biosynthesis